MATNNLLVNNEYKVLREEQQKIERSAHNLSQSRKFPCDVGMVYPFFCRKTLPSDSFKIWSNILIKQLQPLLVPQMVSFTVNTAFYWVDYNLAFPEFEHFLINQRGTQDVELPYVHLPCFSGYITEDTLPPINASGDIAYQSWYPFSRNLRTFLDITKEGSKEKVDALPFWTYNAIIRDFYLNIDRLSDYAYKAWFPSNPNDFKLKAGANFVIGEYELNDDRINGSFIAMDSLRPHDVRGDYFVNSYPTPLRGDIPYLSASSNIDSLSGSVTLDSLQKLDKNTPVLSFVEPRLFFSKTPDGIPLSLYSNLVLNPQDHGVYVKENNSTSIYDNALSSSISPSDNLLTQIEQYSSSLKTYLNSSHKYNGSISIGNIRNLDINLSFTTRQLRLLESLTRKREIDILMKPRLKNYLQTYFGVNRYKDDSLYQPVFIGSTTQQILINDIAQTTSSADSPLGRQGATAISLGSGYVGEFYCRNYGCLMGVMYILPDYDYEPAIPKEWSERVPDEFVNPEFAHLSMSPILNKELFVSDDELWNNEVLGYGGMYDNYRTSTNLVSGDLLNPNYKDIRQFAQVRRFDNTNKPEITTSFLNSNTAFDKSVFSVPTLPPFIAQCVARVEAVRPLPQIAIPRG